MASGQLTLSITAAQRRAPPRPVRPPAGRRTERNESGDMSARRRAGTELKNRRLLRE